MLSVWATFAARNQEVEAYILILSPRLSHDLVIVSVVDGV